MLDKKDVQKVIRESVEIDNEGLKILRTFSIEQITNLGVNDIGAFVQGCMDAENNEDFNDSADDYVKGYSYGKTGKF